LATSDSASVRLPHTYIVCPIPGQPARFPPFAERSQRNGWTCHELAAGHFVFVTMPAELGALLTTVASAWATGIELPFRRAQKRVCTVLSLSSHAHLPIGPSCRSRAAGLDKRSCPGTDAPVWI